jgi:hypothetical protein
MWVRAVTIAMQRLNKQTLNNEATVFHGVRAEVWKTIGISEHFTIGSFQVNAKRSKQIEWNIGV